MSLEVKGKKITLTRGDTLELKVTMWNKTTKEEYIPEEGDVIRFAMKKDYADPEPLLRVNIPIDTQKLHLNPADTKSLEVGPYVYDIEITYASGDVDTFINKGTLILTEEVD